MASALIVPGHHDHAETEPVERGNGACCVLLYVIEDAEDAAHLAVDGDEDGRAACGFQALNRRPGGVGDGPAVLDQPVVPGEHSLTVHGSDAARRERFEPGGRRERERAFLGGVDDGPAERVLAATLGGGGQRQHLILAERAGGHDVRHLGSAFGEGARLVEDDDVEFADARAPRRSG